MLLTDDDLDGESTYNDDLPQLVAALEADGTAVIDDGALCVFVDGFTAPMIVRKRDGGFGYAATDLASIRRRVRDFGADRIIVVDSRQSDHFDQLFLVARKAGFLPATVTTEHVAFGTVLGLDGKPFKTREGTAVTLNDLLDAAEEEAALRSRLRRSSTPTSRTGSTGTTSSTFTVWCRSPGTPAPTCSMPTLG